MLARARFRDGLDSGSYTIILSLRDGSLLLTPFLALRARPGVWPFFRLRANDFADASFLQAAALSTRSKAVA
jgi:hypothetical protein